MDTSKWKLFRAIYNHYGSRFIEGAWPPERFRAEAARGYGIKWVIGVRVNRNKHRDVDVIVEGSEEYLRYILETVTGKKVV